MNAILGSDDESMGYEQTLLDEAAQDAFRVVERQHDLQQAFSKYRGNPRYAAAAWLSAQGYSLQAIGEYFGVSESRACQYRNRFIASVRQEWARVDCEANREMD